MKNDDRAVNRKVYAGITLRFRLPLEGEVVLFLAVTLFAAWHQVSLGALSAPDNRDQVIHSQHPWGKIAPAVVADPLRPLPLPPLARA